VRCIGESWPLDPRLAQRPGAALGSVAVAGRPVRLFISHSSHAPGSLDALKSLAGELGARGVDVLFDKTQITTGDEWRKVINAMLADCDAAAFVITDDAIDSRWVLKEANILLWRRALSAEKFLVLPVQYGALDADGLKESQLWDELSPLQLGRADTANAAADLIAAKLVPLGEMLEDTPLERMAIEIATHLDGVPKPLLLQALLKLGEPLPATVEPAEFARAIARWILAQEPPALTRMAEALGSLGERFVTDELVPVLEYVMPLWVDPDAASWLTRPGLRLGKCRGVGIACTRPKETITHFLRRAHVPGHDPGALWLNAVDDGTDADDVERELKEVLSRAMFDRTRREPRDRDVERQLTQRSRFVVLQLPEDKSVVETLHDRYGNLRWVFHAPIEPPRPGAADAVAWVTPELPAGAEDAVWDDYWDATAGGTG
jgi:hypothetical protein